MRTHQSWILVGLLGLATGCSHLRVKTEVYLQDFADVRERAAMIRHSLEELLAADPGPNVELFASSAKEVRRDIESVWSKLQELHPSVFGGTAEDFAETYMGALRQLEGTTVSRARLESLLAQAKWLEASDPPVYKDPAVLRSKLSKLEGEYQALVAKLGKAMRAAEEAFRGDLRSVALDLAREDQAGEESPIEEEPAAPVRRPDPPADGETPGEDEIREGERVEPVAPAEAGESSVPTEETDGNNGGEPPPPAPPAQGDVTNRQALQLQEETVRLADQLAPERLLVAFAAPRQLLRTLETTAASTAVAPLSDPSIPRIVSAPDSHWKGIFNRVLGETYFGNAEIAIRMESLGVFSMKGVVFDPSKVTQATLDGIDTAVQIAAAASGVPLPKPAAENGDTGKKDAPELPSKYALRAQANDLRKEARERRLDKAKGFHGLLGELSKPLASAEVSKTLSELAETLGYVEPEPMPAPTPPEPASPVNPTPPQPEDDSGGG